ncbi:unnamed protein product, partial [Prorocentrum cordatum]
AHPDPHVFDETLEAPTKPLKSDSMAQENSATFTSSTGESSDELAWSGDQARGRALQQLQRQLLDVKALLLDLRADAFSQTPPTVERDMAEGSVHKTEGDKESGVETMTSKEGHELEAQSYGFLPNSLASAQVHAEPSDKLNPEQQGRAVVVGAGDSDGCLARFSDAVSANSFGRGKGCSSKPAFSLDGKGNNLPYRIGQGKCEEAGGHEIAMKNHRTGFFDMGANDSDSELAAITAYQFELPQSEATCSANAGVREATCYICGFRCGKGKMALHCVECDSWAHVACFPDRLKGECSR